jgi:hypothetical protein
MINPVSFANQNNPDQKPNLLKSDENTTHMACPILSGSYLALPNGCLPILAYVFGLYD